MKKKIIVSIVIVAIVVTSIVAGIVVIASKNKKVKLSTRDMYAMSAATSIAYLSNSGQASSVNQVQPPELIASMMSATEKPTNITDSDITGIKNCLSMFDEIVLGGGFDQSIKNNTSTDALLNDYTFEMNISLPTGSGSSDLCTMYFNEIETATQTKIDDGQKEIETNTTFEGIIVYGDEKFVVEGKREVEVEGNETENSIEFKTYKNSSSTGVTADKNNYVVVEQSFEDDEVEYEYIFYKNGQKIQDIELEYEQTRRSVEIEFQLKDLSSGTLNETLFKIMKGNNSSEFIVTVIKNGKKDKITITKLENNSYKFTYSNGFSQTL